LSPLKRYILSIGISSVSFLTIGYPIAFGQDGNGFIGLLNEWPQMNYSNFNSALFGWSIISLSNSISQTVLIHKVPTWMNVLSTIIIFGFIQPIAIHCSLTRNGWMQTWYDIPYVHHEGSALTHVFSGSFILGILLSNRLYKNVTHVNYYCTINSKFNLIQGYIFIIIGLVGTNIFPLNDTSTHVVPSVIINNVMAIAVGLGVAAIVHQKRDPIPSEVFILQGGLSGLISISNCAYQATTASALLAALIGSSINSLYSTHLKRYLGDHFSMVSIHMFCGSISPYIILLSKSNNMMSIETLLMIGKQCLCNAVWIWAGLFTGFACVSITMCYELKAETELKQIKNQIKSQEGEIKLQEPSKTEIVERPAVHWWENYMKDHNNNGNRIMGPKVHIIYRPKNDKKHKVIILNNPEKIITILPNKMGYEITRHSTNF
jgi:ammonia channel protein AmtB